jgi:hypothetical protein
VFAAPAQALPDTAAAAGPRPASRFDQPFWVMARSLVVPGWGQAKNGKWLKAGLVAGVEITFIGLLVADDRALQDYDRQIEEAREQGDLAAEEAAVMAYNDRLSTFVRRQWLLGAVILYSLLDAYVDAHFRGVDVGIEPRPVAPGTDEGPGARVSLRWRF